MVVMCEVRIHRFIKQAQLCVERAKTMLATGLCEDAARTAYLICFHVAQAYVFGVTDITMKT